MLEVRNGMTGGTVNGQLVQANQVNLVTSEAAWPHQVGVIPTVADAFQPRGLVDLITAGRAVVLSGMGGIGKTQLAAHHAHEQLRGGQVDLLVWVTAGSRQAVQQTYAQAAAELGVPDLLAWLNTTTRRWLVVLDDLQDPADLRGLWPPVTAIGRTVTTTRRRDPALRTADRQVLPVDLFSAAESLAYLTDRLALHDLTEPDDHLAALATDLGHLPLALAQAAAYLIDLTDTGLTAAHYRTLLADRRPLATLAPTPSALPDDQEATLAAVLALSLARADAVTEGLATPMLRLMSVLDPNGIPVNVLTADGARCYLRENGEADAPAVIRALHRLSLADRIPAADQWHPELLRVHVLTQRAAFETVSDEAGRTKLLRHAVGALLSAWTDMGARLGFLGYLRANSASLRPHHPDLLGDDAGRSLALVEAVATSMTEDSSAATEFYHELLNRAVARLGPEHPFVLVVRRECARKGDHAAQDLELLLADQRRLLGERHIETLQTRQMLAKTVGDATAELEVSRRILKKQIRLFGRRAPVVLATRSQIAQLESVAEPARELALLEELLAAVDETNGPGRLMAVNIRRRMAALLLSTDESDATHARLVALADEVSRAVGPDSREGLQARFAVAAGLLRTKGVEAGHDAFRDLAADAVRVLGPEDELTRSLARMFELTGTCLADPHDPPV
ncbi:NB-ARC domain-containing protein [Kitasatospora sp. NPDC097643]|uniref:NB-ARC domain-containing protein n=1 Tax=Kitasatospora sp. NPDC097643 TaxID=3157230 RepID=UPI003333E764